jgi:nitrogen fixation NifU-like protein
MADLTNLYRQVIMDHYKNPLNKGLTHKEGYEFLHLNNPSCGDDMNVEVCVKDGVVTDIRHDGKGCSICCSSASVMSETLKGKSVHEALRLIEDFYLMIEGKEITEEEADDLGEAIAYTGVSQFPARIKCATLSWKAAERIIRGNSNEGK